MQTILNHIAAIVRTGRVARRHQMCIIGIHVRVYISMSVYTHFLGATTCANDRTRAAKAMVEMNVNNIILYYYTELACGACMYVVRWKPRGWWSSEIKNEKCTIIWYVKKVKTYYYTHRSMEGNRSSQRIVRNAFVMDCIVYMYIIVWCGDRFTGKWKKKKKIEKMHIKCVRRGGEGTSSSARHAERLLGATITDQF